MIPRGFVFRLLGEGRVGSTLSCPERDPGWVIATGVVPKGMCDEMEPLFS